MYTFVFGQCPIGMKMIDDHCLMNDVVVVGVGVEHVHVGIDGLRHPNNEQSIV